jgi:23S rRNA pseudouridine1911/1915/1917 synthase
VCPLLDFSVDAAEAGVRLDILVGARPEVGSRSQGAALVEAGAVLVDGVPRPKSFRPEAGQVVTVDLPEAVTAGAAAGGAAGGPDIPVLYEDPWLLVAEKPAGMVVHPAKGHHEGTMVQLLAAHGLAGGEAFRPGVVHRLDRDTSGLLLVAKDLEVHRRLQRMIRAREVDRRYLALVHGNLTATTGTIEAPIGRDPVRRKTMVVDGVAAREAVTHFVVLERFGDFTLLEARLETGRTHQIRVHLLAIGHPVVGDPTYARRDPLGVGRQFLHSHLIDLVHPVSGDRLRVESPLPADLSVPLGRLRAAR